MPRALALRASIALLTWTVTALPALAAQAADPVVTFDALAARARVDWGVPGMAVALVKDGKVLLAKGYGVREQGRPETVDADTLFAAGSTTKAMTVVAIATLVDEGKLGWDDPVRKYIPELRFGDGHLSDSLTVRDLLTHHTGMQNTDYLWATGDQSWKQILAKLPLISPKAPERSRFEYQNVMYGIAGDLVGRVAGMPWEEVVRRRVFGPLGMTNARALTSEVAATGNHVAPHTREDGVLRHAMDQVDPLAAAGAVWVSANDETKWLRFLLDPKSARGADGKPLISDASAQEMFRPQVVIQPDGGFYPTAEKTRPHWTTYGLAWFQQDYRGRKIDFHTGSVDGLVAIVGLARDQSFGVAVLANLDHAELRHALMLSAFDLFLDGSVSRDWNGELRAMYDGIRMKGDEQTVAEEAKRVKDAPPSHPLAAYAGRYTDPLYGDARIEADGDALVLRAGAYTARAVPWNFETFRAAWEPKLYGKSWLTFEQASDGTITAVKIDGTRYARVPDEAKKPAS